MTIDDAPREHEKDRGGESDLFPVAGTEPQRLELLRSLEIVDTPPEPHFDAVCRVAKDLFDLPIVLVSLIEEERQWFKATCGLSIDGTRRDLAFCNYTILSDAVLVVEDARTDPRFAANPLVTGAPGIRFYAGAPLELEPGLSVGTLCVIDIVPRSFSPTERRQLEDLAAIVVAHLRLHSANARARGEIATRGVREALIADQATTLRASETRYRILADSLPQMVWIMDPNNRDTTYANRRFETYYGTIGANCRDRIARCHPDDRAVVERAWQDGFIACGGCEADMRLMRHDGLFRWHKVIIAPIHCGDEIAGWLGTALDIHYAVTAQEALLQSTDLLRIAQIAAGAGAWNVDLVIDAITLSPESAAMHGLNGTRPVILTAAEWNEIVHPGDAVEVWAEVKRSVETMETYSAEFRVPLADGGFRWIHGIGRAHFDAQGHPIRMTGLNFDIDRRKRVEAALIEASEAAEAARREAEKASAAKTDFLAAMSHEIRTPLNSILGYTELLLDAGPHEPLDRTKLSRILGSGRALLTIVNDVLDFSKIEAGRIELEPETFSLAGLIADTMSMISGIAIDKPLALRTDIDPDLPPALVGDQNRLRQVLLNLLNNAVKFTRSGDVVLTMRCDRRIGERLRLRCEISDTGIGVPHDKRDRLFQRFSQIDGSISRRFGGTGLGLAISKNLVELMGGEIGLASRSGPGSTFWFTVELAIGDVAPALVETTVAPMPTHRPIRILLVEDVVMNQDIAMAVLSIGGHHVDLACDGAEAVQAVQNGAYDIVLMDIQMPVMDGIEATTRIRALGGRYAKIPIVALTANVLPEQIESFKRAGMVDHIGKPFRKADLLSAVARWIQAATEAPDTPAPFFDHATFAELRDLLGREKVRRMLGDLESVLTSGFVLDRIAGTGCRDPDRDPAGLANAEVAHKLVSSAGMLGFMSLSETCRAFERKSRAGRLTEVDIDLAAEASRLALAAMGPLRCNPDGLSPMEIPLLRSAS